MKASRGFQIAMIVGFGVCAANGAWADGDGRNKQRAPNNAQDKMGQGPEAGPNAARGGGMRGPGQQAGNGFNAQAYSASMIQQFDQDGDSALNETELAGCLAMLYQQVQQQQQMIAQSAQRQGFQQMSGNRGMSLGGQGGQGGQAGQAACATDSSQSTYSASARFTSRGGQVRGGMGGQGGGTFGGGRGGAGGGGGGGGGGRGGER